MVSRDLIVQLKRELKAGADPAKAPQMQAYMKSKMPYHGVQTPIRRQIFRKLFSDLEFKSEKEWETLVKNLWDKARFREERYCALELTQLKSANEYQTLRSLKLYEHMIVTGAWWDYVDTIASHNVGLLLRKYPKEMKKKMLVWSASPNMWKRRTSIICQLGFGEETDLDLLYSCIEKSIDSKEFFLQKAIGWALRQYAWKNPKEVKRYVKLNQKRLAKLSQREALKNL